MGVVSTSMFVRFTSVCIELLVKTGRGGEKREIYMHTSWLLYNVTQPVYDATCDVKLWLH